MSRFSSLLAVALAILGLGVWASNAEAQGKLSWGGVRYSHAVEMDLCGGAAFDGTVIHIGGQHLDCPAGEMVLPGFGSSGPERFETVESATNPGSSAVKGVIDGVAIQPDGRVLYVGDGEFGSQNRVATYWYQPSSPSTPSNITDWFSFLTACSSIGVFVGKEDARAVVGTESLGLRPLPGSELHGAAGITADAKYIITTNGVYKLIDLATLQYGLMDPTHWDQPEGSLGFGGLMDGVVVTPSGYYFVANDLDQNFLPRVVVWDELGHVVGKPIEVSSYLAVASIDGVPVVVVEGYNPDGSFDDCYIYALGDFNNPKSMFQLTGVAGRVVKDCVCDDGGFGCVLELANGSKGWVSVTADADTTPAPIKVEFVIEPANKKPVLHLDGKGIYVTAILSDAKFDATKIDTRTVRLIDARNLGNPKALALTPSHFRNGFANKDKLRDLFIVLTGRDLVPGIFDKTTTAIAVVGTLKDGTPFYGIAPVTVTVPAPPKSPKPAKPTPKAPHRN